MAIKKISTESLLNMADELRVFLEAQLAQEVSHRNALNSQLEVIDIQIEQIRTDGIKRGRAVSNTPQEAAAISEGYEKMIKANIERRNVIANCRNTMNIRIGQTQQLLQAHQQ